MPSKTSSHIVVAASCNAVPPTTGQSAPVPLKKRKASLNPPNSTDPGLKPLLLLHEVKVMTCCGGTKLYELMKKNQFPRPIKIGRTSAWLRIEVEEWLAQRVVEREQGDA